MLLTTWVRENEEGMPTVVQETIWRGIDKEKRALYRCQYGEGILNPGEREQGAPTGVQVISW